MRLDGRPLPQEEMAVLLPPGGSCAFEFCIPHRPLPAERAQALAAQDFDARHAECRRFWRAKLRAIGSLGLPEKRIDEMARAGLLHLDLVSYGREPEGTVAATIGHYCPIGSESAPIIQFIDSMGWHSLARRALTYFLDKQHADGFIQNFGNYMLETGAALWSIGEHWRYTRDDAWVASVKDKLLKSCDYLIAWRERNLRDDLRGRGYGMLDGKVADPEDPYHIFMLNGYAYLGLARVAEMLKKTDRAPVAPPELGGRGAEGRHPGRVLRWHGAFARGARWATARGARRPRPGRRRAGRSVLYVEPRLVVLARHLHLPRLDPRPDLPGAPGGARPARAGRPTPSSTTAPSCGTSATPPSASPTTARTPSPTCGAARSSRS